MPVAGLVPRCIWVTFTNSPFDKFAFSHICVCARDTKLATSQTGSKQLKRLTNQYHMFPTSAPPQ